MKFYKNLYVSEYMEEKKEKIISKLKKGKFPFTYYIITLVEEGSNHLEIYSTALLYQKKLREEELFIVGIAEGYEEALYLVEEIVKEVYKETGGADICSYIRNMEKE